MSFYGPISNALLTGMSPDRGRVWWHRVLEELAVTAPIVRLFLVQILIPLSLFDR